ncbi:DUF4238 domain-containing protein [Chromohalobacter sp. 296-RDG]|uniref:DUF4238 domain-containing protein n=1 Tax=Chromohalobacter sp. 296-RDG TaxID=2994062 RepID=UPI0024685B9C|nr:DUF4238 domain-containing protein [Chromohalobacter sp. 296-RDG]
MTKLKSALHHWWPRCVSKHWADSDGFTHWITPDGTCKRVPPAKLGMIRNGHHIKLSKNPADSSPWDVSFENEFDRADSNFPSLIDWLNKLVKQELFDRDLRNRFVPQSYTDNDLKILTECVVSLAVRSPKNREAAVSIAEKLRGKLPVPERNTLIGLNLKESQRMITDSIEERAKFAVLFSSGREFIYGDGLFNNVTGGGNSPITPKIIAPITPMMSIIISKPTSFTTEPRISTVVLTDDEVEACNHAVQVYSKEALFYRSDRPALTESFTDAEYLVYQHPDNPMDNLIRHIPGIPPRDRSLDFLL